MQVFALVVTVTLLVTSSLAQFNDVEPDYGDYGAAPAPPPSRGNIAPRSYSAPRGQQLQAAAPRPTPVAILKQINRHNEDGSYTYGYEGGDGSFKIETKLNNGEVVGKYGYVDDVGKVRVVEYGANKFGFQPSGEGITVAPPTLVDESVKQKGNKNRQDNVYYEPESDDGQYYESPAPRPAPRPAPANYAPPRPAPAPARPPPPPPQRQPAPTYENFERTIEFGGPSPSNRGQSSLGPAPPRAQIPGAVPVPSGFSSPSQSRPSAPTQSYFQPSGPAPRPPPPQRAHQPPPQAHRPPSGPGGRSGGILDQLAKDYALPSNGAPALHDISFGYY